MPPPYDGLSKWRVDGGGNWNEAANWDNTPIDSPTWRYELSDALAAAHSPGVVVVNGVRTVGTIDFNSSNTYQLSAINGGAITLGTEGKPLTSSPFDPPPPGYAPGAIVVRQGDHQITAPLRIPGDTGFFIQPNTSLRVSNLQLGFNASAVNYYAGTLIIDGGSYSEFSRLRTEWGPVVLNSNSGSPGSATTPASANLSLYATGGGVVLNADQDLRGLGVGDSRSLPTFDLNSPTDGGGYRSVRVHARPDDIEFHKLSLYQAIVYRATWLGGGILDSGLWAHPNSAIGLAVVSGFGGEQYVLVRPTRKGDVNLDGVVTIADFIDLAAHFGQSGFETTWQEGDMNYDHAVTIADFIDLSANFGGSYAGSAVEISARDQAMLGAFAAAHGGTAVPEPGALVSILLSLSFTQRRRSKNVA